MDLFTRRKPLQNNLRDKIRYLQLAAIANEDCLDAICESMKARGRRDYRKAADMAARAHDLEIDANYFERMSKK